MTTLQNLYEKITKEALQLKNEEEVRLFREKYEAYDQLDCLLYPERYAPVWVEETCDCGKEAKCAKNCLFDAISVREEGGIVIDPEKCVGCNYCVEQCDTSKVNASKDLVGMLLAMKEWKGPVYAIIAPAIEGQFGDVSVGQLRTALKQLGFAGMLEAALFADILTLKEALELDYRVQEESDFQLTSCCCPMWIAMIKKHFDVLIPHVPAAVSPMIAAARTIKNLYPDALCVFIGPCIAKKAEAREKDLVGDVDYVLTFTEFKDLLDFTQIDPSTLESDDKQHASRAGIIYGYAGGVSNAIVNTLHKINPEKADKIVMKHVDGVPNCKALLQEIIDGKVEANFFEGMGCNGGCVGGPKAILPKELGKERLEAYANSVQHGTPVENPYVIELCKRLGLEEVDDLLEHSHIFTREFLK